MLARLLFVSFLLLAVTGLMPAKLFAQNFGSDEDDIELTRVLRQDRYNEAMINGKEALKERRFKEAINYFEIALNLNANSYEAHNLLGDIYSQLKDHVRAAMHYQKASVLIETDIIGKSLVGEKLRNLVFFSSPMETSRNNMFHSTLNVPPMQGARTLPESHLVLMSGMEISQNNFSRYGSGGKNIYNARLYEWFMEANYGITHEFELTTKATIGFLSEIDKDVLIWQDNLQIVPEGQRSIGPSDLYVGMKWEPSRFRGEDEFSGLAIASSFKVPMAADEDMLTSGTVDWNINFIGSKRFDRLIFHGNLGYTFLFRGQSIFAKQINFNDFVTFGFAGVYMISDNMSLIAQIEGNTSAFANDIDVLNSAVTTLTAGLKYRLREDWLLQMGLGVGLGNQSSDFIGNFGLGRHF
ncbi:MAG: DUF3187 family protein [Planctomycetes bacterium]|nr:DUF3187 family protein [Planctomycetota bacterium]